MMSRMGFEKQMQEQLRASMQKAFDRAQRGGKGKSVDSLVRALKRELKGIGVTGVDKDQLRSWAQQISDGVQLRAK